VQLDNLQQVLASLFILCQDLIVVLSRLTRAVWQRLISLPHTSYSLRLTRECMIPVNNKTNLETKLLYYLQTKLNVLYSKIHILTTVSPVHHLRLNYRRGKQRYTTHTKNSTQKTQLHTKGFTTQKKITPGVLPGRDLTHQTNATHCQCT
jgi:hypothetical protein